MNKTNLSKSSYCSGIQCEKILWLDKYKPEYAIKEDNKSIFQTGKEVGCLAKELFGKYENIPYNKDRITMIEQTRKLLENKPNVITEASFSYDNNFCSVDILKNDVDGVEIYEVKSSTKVKDIYLDDASYQYFVLSSLGLNVKKVYIVYINNKYILSEQLNIHELFNIEDITQIAEDKLDEIRNNIDDINHFMDTYEENDEPDTDLGIKCFDPYDCIYWQYCTKDLPKPNVFDIVRMHKSKKFEKYYENKVSFKDLQYEDLNPTYLEQIEFELHDKEPKIDKQAIREIIDSLKYPLYFIDYETCNPAIPVIEGTRPYQQIPFQYSLHIIKDEESEIEHKEFLAKHDDTELIRHFGESLIRDMPENGSVIVYNKSFEATRNKEIGEMYPDLKEEMEQINSNMVDFLVPFKKRKYYTKEMKGSSSIKYVLPALYPDDPELDYHNLPVVHNGREASDSFLSLKNKTPKEQKKIREGLLLYCKLDTYAMVKLYDKFLEVLEE